MNNVLRTLVFDEQVSCTVADTTKIVREAIKLHHLTPVSARILGKALSAMTFMSACLKAEKGEISLSLITDGESGNIGVSGNQQLRLRGYIGNPFLLGTPSVEMEKNALGQVSLTMIRDDGYNRPFVGSCALFGSGLDEAFEEYYRISEQLPTRFASEVEIDEKGECVFAGVAVLQPLPFADEAALRATKESNLQNVLKTLKASGAEGAVLKHFATKQTVWEKRNAEYKCNCSREYLKGVLVSLGEKEFRNIIKEDGAVRVHCHYCNSDYEFTEEDADALFGKEETV